VDIALDGSTIIQMANGLGLLALEAWRLLANEVHSFGHVQINAGPEEDDPITFHVAMSPADKTDSIAQFETYRVEYQLSPHTTGVELRPWPGGKLAEEPKDTVAIAMSYLIAGMRRRAQKT
jgi:predicted MPP superfamily phosphohydrolase